MTERAAALPGNKAALPFTVATTADKLRAARALIADPKDWSAGGLERESGRLFKRCALEAMLAVKVNYSMFIKARDELYPGFDSISGFNVARGHSAVLRVYDRAIELAERQ